MRIQLDGSELYCEVVGRGPPVLLMHGGPGLDHTSFRPWLDPLAEHRRLVFYDQHGNGRSSRPASLEGVTHATWVAEAEALRRHLGLERPVLFGHSYGGYLAQEYALRHGDRLAGLVLCSTAGRARSLDAALARVERTGTARQAARLRGVLDRGIADDAEYAGVFADLLPLYFHAPAAEEMARIVASTRFSAAAFNHAFGTCYPDFDVLDRLPRLRLPTLVLAGRHDWVLPPEETAVPLQRAIPGAELVIFEGSGHYPYVEEPEAFLSTLERWLEEVT